MSNNHYDGISRLADSPMLDVFLKDVLRNPTISEGNRVTVFHDLYKASYAKGLLSDEQYRSLVG